MNGVLELGSEPGSELPSDVVWKLVLSAHSPHSSYFAALGPHSSR